MQAMTRFALALFVAAALAGCADCHLSGGSGGSGRGGCGVHIPIPL